MISLLIEFFVSCIYDNKNNIISKPFLFNCIIKKYNKKMLKDVKIFPVY